MLLAHQPRPRLFREGARNPHGAHRIVLGAGGCVLAIAAFAVPGSPRPSWVRPVPTLLEPTHSARPSQLTGGAAPDPPGPAVFLGGKGGGVVTPWPEPDRPSGPRKLPDSVPLLPSLCPLIFFSFSEWGLFAAPLSPNPITRGYRGGPGWAPPTTSPRPRFLSGWGGSHPGAGHYAGSCPASALLPSCSFSPSSSRRKGLSRVAWQVRSCTQAGQWPGARAVWVLMCFFKANKTHDIQLYTTKEIHISYNQ